MWRWVWCWVVVSPPDCLPSEQVAHRVLLRPVGQVCREQAAPHRFFYGVFSAGQPWGRCCPGRRVWERPGPRSRSRSQSRCRPGGSLRQAMASQTSGWKPASPVSAFIKQIRLAGLSRKEHSQNPQGAEIISLCCKVMNEQNVDVCCGYIINQIRS